MTKPLLAILTLTALLRLPFLADIPAGFTADEASQGYTAYSILKTGRDEWGEFLPLNPRSFGDFKPPFYTYAVIPSIALFGLTEAAVRLPAALFGIAAVLATYLLATQLFRRNLATDHPPSLKLRGASPLPITNHPISLIAAFLLAFSPWHLAFSRSGLEAGLTAFFFPLGLYFFLRAKSDPRFYLPAAFFWGFNLYTYHSARFFTLLFAGFLLFWQRRRILDLWGEQKKLFVGVALIAGIFLLPLGVNFLTGGGTVARFTDVTIFNPTDRWEFVAKEQFRSPLPFPFNRIFVNKATRVAQEFSRNYLSYFSLSFLFTEGSPDTSYANVSGRGLLFLWQLPLVLAALFFLYKKQDKKLALIFAVWALLAALPAALSKDAAHANRASPFIPLWPLISAYGAYYLWFWLKENFSAAKVKIVTLGYLAVILISTIFFLEFYFVRSPSHYGKGMKAGYQEAVEFVASVEEEYEQIIFDRRLSEPQAFIAFYTRFDPEKFQAESPDWLRYQDQSLVFVDQLGEYWLGKYKIREINWESDKRLAKTLLVGAPEHFVTQLREVKHEVYYPSGELAIVMVDPQE